MLKRTSYLLAGTVLGLVLLGTSLASAQEAAPNLRGSWVVTFYSEPDHSLGAVRCFVFTRTGGVLGEPNSGTFVETTFPDWDGFWLQEGDHITIVGNTGVPSNVTMFGELINNQIIGGEEFAEYFNLDDFILNAGAWTGNKTSSCAHFAPLVGGPSATR